MMRVDPQHLDVPRSNAGSDLRQVLFDLVAGARSPEEVLLDFCCGLGGCIPGLASWQLSAFG